MSTIPPPRSKTILLIEDNEDHAAIIREEMLGRTGFPDDTTINLVWRKTLQEALLLLEQGQDFHEIYLDPGLPDVGDRTFEAYDAVRRLAPHSKIKVTTNNKDRGLEQRVSMDRHADILYKHDSVGFREGISQTLRSLRSLPLPPMPPQNPNAGAMGEMQSDIRNLWREIEESKEALREHVAELRNLVQRSQDQTVLAVEDLPVELALIKQRLNAAEKSMEGIGGKLSDLAEIVEAGAWLLKTIRWIKDHWRTIAAAVTAIASLVAYFL